jgi:hypothetical protein
MAQFAVRAVRHEFFAPYREGDMHRQRHFVLMMTLASAVGMQSATITYRPGFNWRGETAARSLKVVPIPARTARTGGQERTAPARH